MNASQVHLNSSPNSRPGRLYDPRRKMAQLDDFNTYLSRLEEFDSCTAGCRASSFLVVRSFAHVFEYLQHVFATSTDADYSSSIIIFHVFPSPICRLVPFEAGRGGAQRVWGGGLAAAAAREGGEGGGGGGGVRRGLGTSAS